MKKLQLINDVVPWTNSKGCEIWYWWSISNNPIVNVCEFVWPGAWLMEGHVGLYSSTATTVKWRDEEGWRADTSHPAAERCYGLLYSKRAVLLLPCTCLLMFTLGYILLPYYKFTAKTVDERILKIDQYLANWNAKI